MGGTAHSCGRCRGAFVSSSLLHLNLDDRALADLWRRAKEGSARAGRPCPACNKSLTRWREPAPSQRIELDACLSCETIWFDAGEIEKLRNTQRKRNENAVSAKDILGADLGYWALPDIADLLLGSSVRRAVRATPSRQPWGESRFQVHRQVRWPG